MRPRTLGVLFVVMGALTYAAAWISWRAFLVLAAVWLVVTLVGLATVLARPATDAGYPPLRLALTVCGVLVGLLVSAALIYRFAPVPVGATSLRVSLERETGSAGYSGDCERSGDEGWRCDVADRQGSGSATYEVEVDGTCWKARRSSPEQRSEGPMPARAEGCTRLRDRIML